MIPVAAPISAMTVTDIPVRERTTAAVRGGEKDGGTKEWDDCLKFVEARRAKRQRASEQQGVIVALNRNFSGTAKRRSEAVSEIDRSIPKVV